MAKIDPSAKQSAASFGRVSLASGTNRDANEDSKDDDVVMVEDTCETANYLCSFDDPDYLIIYVVPGITPNRFWSSIK